MVLQMLKPNRATLLVMQIVGHHETTMVRAPSEFKTSFRDSQDGDGAMLDPIRGSWAISTVPARRFETDEHAMYPLRGGRVLTSRLRCSKRFK
jgi:hypothetical protein